LEAAEARPSRGFMVERNRSDLLCVRMLQAAGSGRECASEFRQTENRRDNAFDFHPTERRLPGEIESPR
jgi:hypothetical protein